MRVNEEKKCVEIFDAHWYKVSDGVYYPSVTSVLQTINKGYGYDDWLKNVGHNAEVIVKKAQESGSKIHNAIEKYLNGEKIIPVLFDEIEWVKMCNFANWANGLNIKVIATETELFDDDMRIAGTADLVCKIDDTIYLIDFKTGNNIYSTSHLQVSCYVEMWNKKHGLHNRIQKAGLLHIGSATRKKDGLNNKGIKFEETDLIKYSKLFHHTLAIYNEMFRKNPPMLEYPMELEFKKGEN